MWVAQLPATIIRVPQQSLMDIALLLLLTGLVSQQLLLGHVEQYLLSMEQKPYLKSV